MTLRSMVPAALLSGLLLTLSACAGGAQPVPEASTSSETQESAEESPTRLPPIEVEEGVVPNLTGYSLHEAIVALREGRLLYEMEGDGFVHGEQSQATRDWTVTGQSPAAGAEVEPRSTVQLTVERSE